ncbi:hypothetical protein GCM10025876_38710 [Demequina litorisediminis]|uniref:Uncharacterized protein n=1 Tax=Demequina litorisediminis TaxID=1849022 RepID=A0ABQ6IKJ1_9MICO|nr:hypothetical protein GCM10025876_38710 [Demequina litorisediminis]
MAVKRRKVGTEALTRAVIGVEDGHLSTRARRPAAQPAPLAFGEDGLDGACIGHHEDGRCLVADRGERRLNQGAGGYRGPRVRFRQRLPDDSVAGVHRQPYLVGHFSLECLGVDRVGGRRAPVTSFDRGDPRWGHESQDVPRRPRVAARNLAGEAHRLGCERGHV